MVWYMYQRTDRIFFVLKNLHACLRGHFDLKGRSMIFDLFAADLEIVSSQQ